ncbi:MAG: SpoIVB peptidase S55 domain-containing protein [Planctomycetota bacterium]|jgi:hypothetical protein
MKRKKARRKILLYLMSVVLPCALCRADTGLDKSRYIGIDEIKPGMKAYCYTVYQGTEIEKFELDVLSVIRNWRPGKNAILVIGTDKRFIHTGPVHGCSGSPVFIDDRMAGALAWGYEGTKDPLYLITPIDEMLRAGTFEYSPEQNRQIGFGFDFSRPIDFAEINRKIKAAFKQDSTTMGIKALPCPLVISPLSAQSCRDFDSFLRPLGFMPVSGLSTDSNGNAGIKAELVPGATLAIPVVTGDIRMTSIGTVTEVVGEKVYGLGHGWLDYGPIDLPMATGYVHTVVSHLTGSFKMASALEIVGAIKADESTAVYGWLGARARMIPLRITVDRYNDSETRTYNCQLAINQVLTPMVLGLAVQGAATMLGELPPENSIEYSVRIATAETMPICYKNISTASAFTELTTENIGTVAMLLNNPYRKAQLTSIELDVKISDKNLLSKIRSVDLSDTKVKPGDNIDVSVVLENYLAESKKYQFQLEIPKDLPPGEYNMIVSGSSDYQEFVRKSAPYRFTPRSLDSLVGAINELLQMRRDRLYCLLPLPEAGVAVEQAELPDLPATKSLILSDASRTLKIQPYQRWLEKSIQTHTVVIDDKIMKITVQ